MPDDPPIMVRIAVQVGRVQGAAGPDDQRIAAAALASTTSHGKAKSPSRYGSSIWTASPSAKREKSPNLSRPERGRACWCRAEQVLNADL
jgi:hypothetical protein